MPTERVRDVAVSYPFALTEAGEQRWVVTDADDGPRFCPSPRCGLRMAPVRGTSRAWHYRHIKHECADPEPPIHALTQRAVAEAVEARIANPDSRLACRYQHSCGCERVVSDIGDHHGGVRSVTLECSVVDGTRSDVVIELKDGALRIIEVVHTHDIEDRTLDLYLAAGHRVYRMRASREAVKAARSGLLQCLDVATEVDNRCAEHWNQSEQRDDTLSPVRSSLGLAKSQSYYPTDEAERLRIAKWESYWSNGLDWGYNPASSPLR